MAEIKEGDEVMVYGVGRDRHGALAKVVKVGRTLVHVERHHRVNMYYLDTQRLNSHQVDMGSYFRTLDQVEAEKRRGEALKALRECGLTPDSPNAFTAEQVEALIMYVRSFGGQR